MTTPPMLSFSLARLSLCFAPLFLLACLEDDARLTAHDDELFASAEPEGMHVTAPAATPRAAQPAGTLTIDLMTYPDAQCNDGSAPVVKVKLDPNGGTNWLVYLQGGGSCSTVDECEERWSDCTGGPDDVIGWKGNMRANTSAMDFDGWGILDFDGQGGQASPFAGLGFNRVFIPYCSSDQWRGLGNAQSVSYAATCGDPGGLTTLHFGGGKIVEAVIAEIMASQQAPESGDFIVLAGGSAGGMGVQYNLDRVTAQAQAIDSGIAVVGVADASYTFGLDQDGIPNAVSVDEELFWAGQDPATVIRNPGDAIDVVVDDSCRATEIGADKEWCHDAAYAVANYADQPLMLTSNSFDDAIHGGVLATMSAFWPTECGVTITDTNGADPCQDALYFSYCAPPPGVDPSDDIESWLRYQTAAEGTAILDTTTNLSYYVTHSSLGLHDQLLKDSDNFYRRASDSAPLNVVGAYEFAGLGGWTSSTGNNADPSIATTVACALGLVGVPGAPSNCDLADVRVTSDLPTQVTVIESCVN